MIYDQLSEKAEAKNSVVENKEEAFTRVFWREF